MPLPPPDYQASMCNTAIEDGARGAQVSLGAMNNSETWYYEITNSTHDRVGFTNDYKIYRATAGGTVLEVPTKSQAGVYGDWDAVLLSTGTFVTSVGTIGQPFVFVVSGMDYSDTPAVDECWTIKLWRGGPPVEPPPPVLQPPAVVTPAFPVIRGTGLIHPA